jgi:transposase-like protein
MSDDRDRIERLNVNNPRLQDKRGGECPRCGSGMITLTVVPVGGEKEIEFNCTACGADFFVKDGETLESGFKRWRKIVIPKH